MDARGDTPRRWMSVGSSAAADSRHAGVEAAAGAMRSGDARLLVVFCSARHDPEAVLAGIDQTAPGVPLIGCSSGTELTSERPSRGGVVVTAFGGPGFSVRTAAATGAAGQPRQAGVEVARDSDQADGRPDDGSSQVLLLLTDGRAPDQEEILSGVYQVVGASVPLVGGCASDDPGAGRMFQLHGREVLTDAVVGATISSDGPLGIAVRHGWRRIGQPMIVTRSTKGRVYTLDDRPAVQVYLRRHGASEQLVRDPEAFQLFSRTRPVGVRRRSGEEVRDVSSTRYLGDGALGSSGDIPEGGLIWLMETDEDSLLRAADDACRDAGHALDGHDPLGFLAFNCASRGDSLGTEGMRREVARLAGRAADAPIAGFYTWGEIARVRGITGFHHQTLVLLAVG
jgi:hypothetical protein